MPPGRTYLFQAADDFEMNEWINLINYASTFKTADIPMRSAVVSKDRAFLAGAAAAASHKRERPIPGTTISKSPRKSVFGATEGKDPDVVSPSEVPLRPSFVRLDSATLKAAVDVSPADTLGQEPTENLAEIFDVVKADLAAERVASKPSTGSSSRHSADAQPERIETIEVSDTHLARRRLSDVALRHNYIVSKTKPSTWRKTCLSTFVLREISPSSRHSSVLPANTSPVPFPSQHTKSGRAGCTSQK